MVKKIISAVLILAMILTLAACGSDQKTKEAIVGKWYYRYDISDKLTRDLTESNEEMMGYFDFRDLFVEIEMVVTPEGNYQMTVDQDSVSTMTGRMKKQMLEGLNAYLTGTYGDLAGMLDVEALMDEAFPVDEIAAGFQIPGESGTVSVKGTELTFQSEGGSDSGSYNTDTDTLVLKADIADLGIDEITMKRK